LIHHFGTNDIYEIGGRGGKKDFFLMSVLAFGLASLSGIPPLGGFFSKDAILHELRGAGLWAYAAGHLVTLFTAFYSCRLVCVILRSRVDHKPHGHAAPAILRLYERLPLLLLAGL
jgi:NADH-quinone oxidoreductase subunit L